MVRGPRRGSSRSDARIARKLLKAENNSFGGYAGMSIIEMLEERLTHACKQYVKIEAKIDDHISDMEWHTLKQNARGQIRGLAIAIAMMRHPLRRYERVWWDYVKKLERRHIATAREQFVA